VTTPIDTSLAPVDATAVPAGVRSQGAKAVGLYDSALQFEQLLTQQIAQSIVPDDSSSDDSDSSDDPDDSTSHDSGLRAYQGMLPDALAQSVTGAGGFGLAIDLYRSLGGQEAKGS
jgi:Rod binding domain-containing protein